MSDCSEAMQNEVDAKVMEVFDEDEDTMGVVLGFLCLQPQHYSKLWKLKSRDTAFKACIRQLLTASSSFAGADQTREDDRPLDEIEAEHMLMECKDRYDTQLLRLEKAGIVSKSIQEGLKKSSASMAVGAAAAATQLVGMSAAAAGRAASQTVLSHMLQGGSYVSALRGDFLRALILRDSSAAAGVEAAASKQLATRFSNMGTVCKWTSRAGVVLTVGMLGYDFYYNVRDYYSGKIDGYTCAQNLTASCCSVAAGIGGGAAACALCAGAGPWGLAFAGVAGGILASGLSEVGVRAIFEGFFGSDRDRAVGRAYETLGLKKGSTPEEIRHVYLQRAKKTHPDKGGDEQEFIKINSAYELIRASLLAR